MEERDGERERVRDGEREGGMERGGQTESEGEELNALHVHDTLK